MSGNGKACVILAAGKGTRMRSAVPKVLHPIAGRPMLAHVLATAHAAGIDRPVVVVGPDMDDVAACARAVSPDCRVAVQPQQDGTADAVKAAKSELEGFSGPVLVLFADTPLIEPATLEAMQETIAGGDAVVVLGFRPDDPTGYGRLVCDDDGAVTAIREHLDASEDERAIPLCNSGVMGFDGAKLYSLVDRIGNDNAKGEYYLTDAVEIARAEGHTIGVSECPADEVLGINSRAQLAQAEALFQARARAAAMAGGVTLQAPDTVTLSADTQFGTDVTVEPNVVFGPGVTVGSNVHIKGFSHLEGATIADDATVGPFARLRPGAEIGVGARVGNFVEIKNAVLEAGAKANHLTYLGDARIGHGANIGAGTITCNYDGFGKYRTEIGAGAFIGSNSSLVAPVTIGNGAYVASGSVITETVEADALAIGRGRQSQKAGWARRMREEQTTPARRESEPRAKARETT